MHELCLPVLDPSKDMWKKVDPSYIPSGMRIDLTGETPICTNKDLKQQLKYPKEFGTITEFYFMELEMIHFGLMHSFHKYQDIRKIIERLQNDKKSNAQNKEMVEKIDSELKHLKPFRIGYELSLCDSNLAKLLEKFYMTHMRLMRLWGNFDQK